MAINITKVGKATLITERKDGNDLISISVGFNCGPQLETKDKAGIFHFIEHLMFKNGKKYSSQDIDSMIDCRGAYLNAETSKSCVSFHAICSREFFRVILDILNDMFSGDGLTNDSFIKEKNIVIQEIDNQKDQHFRNINNLLIENCYKNSIVANNNIGTLKSLNNITLFDVKRFIKKYFVQSNMTISVVGNYDSTLIEAQIKNTLLNGILEGNRIKKSIVKYEYQPLKKQYIKNCDQTYIAWGIPVKIDKNNILRSSLTIDIISSILGGRTISRLNQQIREKLQLTYSIYSYVLMFKDASHSLLAVRTNIANNKIKEVIKEVEKILFNFIDGIDEYHEYDVIINGLMARREMNMEKNSDRSSQYMYDYIYWGQCWNNDDFIKQIGYISAKNINQFIKQELLPERWTRIIFKNK